MIRGRELIGMPVFSLDNGREVGTVRNLIFHPEHRRVIGFILREGGLLRDPEVVSFDQVETIGPDTIVLRRESDKVVPSIEVGPVELKESFNLTGRKVITDHGHDLGTIYDLLIEETTGEVMGFDLTQGVIRDASVGKRYVDYDHIRQIGNDAVIVHGTALEEITVQKGGLAATYENFKETGVESLEKARGTYRDVKESSLEKAREAYQSVKETGSESLEKAREKSELLTLRAREKGDLLSSRFRERKEAWGTSTKGALTGLSAKSLERMERGKKSASGFFNRLSDRFSEGVEEIRNYLQRLREQIENYRIEQALGRRVSRTILDPADHVILQQGDIITHQAILQARQAGLLDSVLNSVVKENILMIRRKETESASEEIFAKRPSIPTQPGDKLQKAG